MKRFFESFLAWCVRRGIRRERPRIVAVAGSVGKSSTKEAIATALGAFETPTTVRSAAKNYNNELGVPLTILNAQAPGRSIVAWLWLLLRAKLLAFGLRGIGARTLVLEFGTDHPGDIAALTRIAPPNVAVVTAIGAEHTEFFGSVEAVAKEELSILRGMTKDGVAILNADDARVMAGRNLVSGSVVTFGESIEADVRLTSCRFAFDGQDITTSGIEMSVAVDGEAVHFRLRGVFGKPHALAATAALAVAKTLHIPLTEAAHRLSSYRSLPGRTRIIEGVKRTTLLDDTYNSSPLAAHSALRDLAAFPVPEGSKRVAALGDMLELGELATSSHEEVGRAVAASGVDMLVCCGTLAHVVADAAKSAGMPGDRIFTFAKSPESGLFIQDQLRPGDVILIKGSQGSRMEKVTKELMAEPLRAAELLVRQTAEWLAK